MFARTRQLQLDDLNADLCRALADEAEFFGGGLSREIVRGGVKLALG